MKWNKMNRHAAAIIREDECGYFQAHHDSTSPYLTQSTVCLKGTI
jgi:hypothetical protein